MVSPPGTTSVQPVEVRGHRLRRSLRCATWAWVFGSIWFSVISGSPLTNYARALKSSEFQFGLLAALPFLASLLSLPASALIESTGKRKRIFLLAFYFQRLMWIPIGLIPLWIFRNHPERVAIAMGTFLFLVFFMYTGQAFGGPAWVSWMADVVPDRVRGKYFARRRAIGVFTAVPTALIVGYLLDRHTNPGDRSGLLIWCGGIFVVSAVFGFLDIELFRHVPDIPKAPKETHLFRELRGPLRDRQYLRFAGYIGVMFFSISFMGQFVTKYVMEQAEAQGAGVREWSNSITQLVTIIAPNLGMLLVLSAWGRAADRMGKKPLLMLASLGLVPVALGWCLLRPGNVYLGFLLSAAGQMLWCGVEIANMNLMMEMSTTQGDDEGNGSRSSAYVAVNSVIVNLAGGLGGITAGIVAQSLRQWEWVTAYKTFTYYDVLFAMSGGLRLLAVVAFLPFVHEPTARPTIEALRFMTANMYNNFLSVVQTPLKLLRKRRREEGLPAD